MGVLFHPDKSGYLLLYLDVPQFTQNFFAGHVV
jgi:hypothetical protein